MDGEGGRAGPSERASDDHEREDGTSCVSAATAASKRASDTLNAAWLVHVAAVARLNYAATVALERWGGVVARRPWTVVIVTTVLALAAGLHGLSLGKIDNDTERLWSPENSKSLRNKGWYEDYYGERDGIAAVMHSALGLRERRNVVTVADFDELWRYDAMLKSVVHNNRTYEDICKRKVPGGPCAYYSPLQNWCSHDGYVSDVKRAADPQAALEATVGRHQACEEIMPAVQWLYGLPRYDDAGVLSYSVVLRSVYLVDMTLVGKDELDDFFSAMRDVMEPEIDRNPMFGFTFNSALEQELDRVIAGDLKLLAFMFMSLFVFMSLLHASPRWRDSRVTLALCGVACVLLSVIFGLGTACALGVPIVTLTQALMFLFAGIGVDDILVLTNTMHALNARSPDRPLQERVELTVRHAGLSITVTSLTNAIAFMCGNLSDVPCIRVMASQSVCIILADYFLQLTVFLSCMVLFERRADEARGRAARRSVEGVRDAPADDDIEQARAKDDVSVSCSLKTGELDDSAKVQYDSRELYDSAEVQHDSRELEDSTEGQDVAKGALAREQTASAEGQRTSEEGATSAITDDPTPAKSPSQPPRQVITGEQKRLPLQGYAHVLLQWPVKLKVVAVFVLAVVGSVLSFPNIKEGLPLLDLIPDGSFLTRYITWNDDSYNMNLGEPMYLTYHHIDESDLSVQARLVVTHRTFLRSPHISPASTKLNWYDLFVEWLRLTRPDALVPCAEALPDETELCTAGEQPSLVKTDVFWSHLHDFLTAFPYVKDLVIVDNSTGTDDWIRVQNMEAIYTAAVGNDYQKRKDVFRGLMSLTDELEEKYWRYEAGGFEPKLFAWSTWFPIWESMTILQDETIQTITAATCGLLVVSLLTLISPFASVLLVSLIFGVSVMLFGWMYILDIRFNHISFILIFAAFGLAVDYSMHVMHTFLSIGGKDARGRLHETLGTIGYAVLQGGGTTLVASVPLLFASSSAMRIIGQLTFGLILIGLITGLVLLPVLCDLLGDSSLPPILHTMVIAFINPVATQQASKASDADAKSLQGRRKSLAITSLGAPDGSLLTPGRSRVRRGAQAELKDTEVAPSSKRPLVWQA